MLLGAAVSGKGHVRGDALSVVVIDKLPFAPPDDPVLRRASARCASRPQSVAELQIPATAIALKQG
ncbi:MAG: ATP-dependent DNA helicase, partial [Xanthomonadales bacterium]|nr:ATP-dependent DNA helicase [Xanthomonadales bacterium]